MMLNQGQCHFICLGRNTENEAFVLTKKKGEEQYSLRKNKMKFIRVT